MLLSRRSSSVNNPLNNNSVLFKCRTFTTYSSTQSSLRSDSGLPCEGSEAVMQLPPPSLNSLLFGLNEAAVIHDLTFRT